MLKQNMKTLVLAASMLTLFAACAKKDASKADTSRQATVAQLNKTFKPIDARFDVADQSLANKIAGIGITSGDKQEGQNGLTNIDIKFAGAADATVLATIDDWSTLQSGQTVELSLFDQPAASSALGGTPVVKAKCLDQTCAKVALLISENAPANRKVVKSAAFVFDGDKLTLSQSQVIDLNAAE